MAWIMLALKRPDLINENMEDALGVLSNSSELRHFFGNYPASQRHYDKAQKFFMKAISISEEHRIIRSDYAVSLRQMSNNDQAIEIFLQLVDEEQNSRFLFLLFNVQLQSSDREGARKTVLKFLSIDPSFSIFDELSALFQFK